MRSLVETDVPLAELAAMKLTSLDYGNVEANATTLAPLFGKGFTVLEHLRLTLTHGDSGGLAKRLLEAPLGKRLQSIDVGITMFSSSGFDGFAQRREADQVALAALFAPAAKLHDVTLRALHSFDKGWGSWFHLEHADGLTVAIGMTSHEAQERMVVEDILAALPAIAKLTPAAITLAKPPKTKALGTAIAKAIKSL